ncbi:Peptidase S8, pro-domain,Peptidase S8, subtilisin, Asp-active site,Kexin/furin catalytic [Cinara cedri]|uniref:Neuroendocrine convertase 2 n=1 Tax=Cinara cedri TaxID=506608 RepID=A0A5E4MVV5_9HEMI|nr:Peptidase S8, pro-domain,Peptidase S8, subtilisin, Asp-active site,Kexin/furin catalytic [Cinara cedri]
MVLSREGDLDKGGRYNRERKADRSEFSAKALTFSTMAVLWCAFLLVATSILPASRMVAGSQLYTNTFSVKLHGPDGANGHVDEAVAHQVAKRAGIGFQNVGKIRGTKDEFQFVHHGLPKIRGRRSIPSVLLLKKDPSVKSVHQQPGFKRVKRGYKPLMPSMYSYLSRHEFLANKFNSYFDKAVEIDEDQERYGQLPKDPLFKEQWYLRNTGQNGGKPKLDLNVRAAWAQGVSGKNVTTAIMDDGVDYTHEDLKYNYNARASYDFSSNDPYPYPRYTDDWFNSHGTRCAGEVSAARDNGVCGTGVAYDSKIAGIRMLDQPYMTDLIEANSMGHEPDLIDIYSASWGPTDDGRTVDGPRNATMRAIVRGVNEGRRGKGNIYVWASGDGGEADDCNCDGYAASMWTISINSAINDGQNAHYDESCSSTLASTFSNGAKDPNTGVATTDLYGKCTKSHSGTSAAAPEAAGVFALALEANPDLTWRDIQHLTVLTSKRNSLFDAKHRFQWTMNGVGLEFNHLFGFGVLDAGGMVSLAKQWHSVPARYHCQGGSHTKIRKFTNKSGIILKLNTDACKGTDTHVKYLEHVQAVITLNSTRRGDVELFLISPMGTRSMILSRRPNDDDRRDGFTKWPFMTTHTWGEYPWGEWTLEVKFNTPSFDRYTKQFGKSPNAGSTAARVRSAWADAASSRGRYGNVDIDRAEEAMMHTGFLKEWTLMLHGTRDPPYSELAVLDPHSKLAIVKKAHTIAGPDTTVTMQQQSAY